jgi:hypothetical protein
MSKTASNFKIRTTVKISKKVEIFDPRESEPTTSKSLQRQNLQTTSIIANIFKLATNEKNNIKRRS